MSADYEVRESVAKYNDRLEHRANALRILSMPILIAPYLIVMFVWGGNERFDMVAGMALIFGICGLQLVAWRWREIAKGTDDGERRYWWGLYVVLGVALVAVLVWYLVL